MPTSVAILEQGKRGRKHLLFVNKKKQKNFIRWRPGQGHCASAASPRKDPKVFLLLFLQKKKTLASLLARPNAPGKLLPKEERHP
jgi:hypothetical protein